MGTECCQSCSWVTYCYEYTKNALAATIIKLQEIRSDPDAFQKISLTALAMIREINFQCETHYFSHAVHLLDTAAPAFDFYGFCRLPHLFFHPYMVERFDEYAILDQMEAILCDNWHLGLEDVEGKNRDPLVRQFAKDQLKTFLEKMAENDFDFISAEEVRGALHKWMEKTLENCPQEDFNPDNIDLDDLEIVLKKSSLIEIIITSLFISVDLLCVPDFLQNWELIDLAPHTDKIGRIPLFCWVPNQTLESWVWGLASMGHFLVFLKTGQELWEGELSSDEAKHAKWLIVSSLAECLYSLSNVLKINSRLINYYALIAKSLGVIVFLAASKPTFFGDDD